MLQSQQRPGIQEAEVGKIVRDLFGPDVHRMKTKHKGESPYKYFGIKRELKDNRRLCGKAGLSIRPHVPHN